MTEHPNVRPIPKREELPPEIAAMGIPVEDEDEIEVILNASEANLGATYRDFRPGVLIPALVGWATERPLQALRHHQLASAVTATAIASTVIVSGIHSVLNGDDTPITQPAPAPSVVIVTPPTSSATRQPSTPTPTRTEPPRESRPPVQQPTERPPTSYRQSPDPRPSPSTSRPRPGPESPNTEAPRPTRTRERPTEPPAATSVDVERDPPDTEDIPSPTDAPPQPGPEATSEPPPPAPDTPTQAARDCVIRVDVDPLLDVCLLS